MPTDRDLARQAAEMPLYWFARLERAIDEGDERSHFEAIRELRRLGFDVRAVEPAA